MTSPSMEERFRESAHPSPCERALVQVSGSAFKREKGTLLHHGTMLINLDMKALQNYLNPHKLKLLSKGRRPSAHRCVIRSSRAWERAGVQSVTARVVNISELNPKVDHRVWCSHLTASFLKDYGQHAHMRPAAAWSE
jgi:lipoate-protein ligase A